jgi:hypothetical protein
LSISIENTLLTAFHTTLLGKINGVKETIYPDQSKHWHEYAEYFDDELTTNVMMCISILKILKYFIAFNIAVENQKVVLQLKRIQTMSMIQATPTVKVSATKYRLDLELNARNKWNEQDSNHLRHYLEHNRLPMMSDWLRKQLDKLSRFHSPHKFQQLVSNNAVKFIQENRIERASLIEQVVVFPVVQIIIKSFVLLLRDIFGIKANRKRILEKIKNKTI